LRKPQHLFLIEGGIVHYQTINYLY
jgi:hypothetical protein